MSAIKEKMTQIIHDQPDDASLDEILSELALLRMVERGLADSKSGKTISHDQMRQEIESWHQ